jgi:preprotein translocase subunit SecD
LLRNDFVFTQQLDLSSKFTKTELTGRFLDKATLEFNPTTGEPTVALQFDAEGSKLFEKITRENVGKTVAIFLDGLDFAVTECWSAQLETAKSFKPYISVLLNVEADHVDQHGNLKTYIGQWKRSKLHG